MTPSRGSRTPAGDALSELVVHVFRLNGLLVSTGDSLAQPAGQTSARWRVLATVEDGPSTIAQIARDWGLARQSVQRVADVLVEERYCLYEENPGHRRAQLLRITPRGPARATHDPGGTAGVGGCLGCGDRRGGPSQGERSSRPGDPSCR